MRVHEFAKQINKDSKEVIAILTANGIEGKKTMSSIAEKEMELVLEKIQEKKKSEAIPEKKQGKEQQKNTEKKISNNKQNDRDTKNKNTE